MVKKWLLLTLIIFLVLVYLSRQNLQAAENYNEYNIVPILDNNVDASLNFTSIDSFKTTVPNVILAIEDWRNSDKSVTIVRWFFSSRIKLNEFLESVDSAAYVGPFNGWDKITDIGDNTWWIYPNTVVFAKNNVLVKVYVMNRKVFSEKDMKEYTRLIAKSIVNKL